MRFSEIGQQLRAYRLESGLRAEEIAARLGVSRAALYRYEKGEVIKLDTVQRLAELLKVSPLSLLGIGMEYYSRPAAFFERLRQAEETAEQILQVGGPVCYLTTSDPYDAALAEAWGTILQEAGGDQPTLRLSIEQVAGILAARKRVYAARRPNIIAILAAGQVYRFLRKGVAGGMAVADRTRQIGRQAARAEMEHIAGLIESEPMGLQFGLLPVAEPHAAFTILRGRERASLALSPFPPDGHPATQNGVAMLTGAEEAIAAHQRVAEASWRDALKGARAAAELRRLLAEAEPQQRG